MNKLLYLLLFIFSTTTIFAQDAPPQAVCYQAVATDAEGRELMGADLAIRATILKGSPTGQVAYQEIQETSTDDFGLFNINIGEGSLVGGDALSNIDWGAGTYFLKMEMDPVSGSNFVELGTSQILSVPYALYSGKAAFADSASMAVAAETALDDFDKDPANEIQELGFDPLTGSLTLTGSNTVVTLNLDDDDSDPLNEIQSLSYDGSELTLTGPLGGSTVSFENHLFRSAGASFDYPQGILGDHRALTMGFFTVPQGMVFYLTGSEDEVQFSHPDVNSSNLVIGHATTPNMPIFKEGTVLTNCRCTGFLVEEKAMVEPVYLDLTDMNNTYNVPSGKTLFLKSGLVNDFSGYLKMNGMDIEFFRPNLSRWTRVLTFPAGTTLARPNLTPTGMDNFILTGFLIDN
ncbi:MAG: hypothetical protein ACI9XO_003880 [Paraglaciecola sp.]|jgi:hypothetical protein